MSAGTCKACGAHITWAKTHENKSIPLTKVKAYTLARPFFGHSLEAIATDSETYISHFITCPKVEKISGSKPKRGT